MWESFAPRSPGAALGEVGSGAQGGGGGVRSGEGSGQRLSLSSVSSWPALWGSPGLVHSLGQPSLQTRCLPRPSSCNSGGAYDFSEP